MTIPIIIRIRMTRFILCSVITLTIRPPLTHVSLYAPDVIIIVVRKPSLRSALSC